MSSRQQSVLWLLLALAALLGSALAAGAIVEWVPWPSPFKRQLAAAMLQFIVLTLAGGVFTAWWVGRTNWPIGAVSPRATWIAVLAGIAAYAVGLSSLSLFRLQALLTGIWVLGYYAQLTWEVSQLQIPRSSIWHDAVWGNHGTFILAAAAPFLRLYPDPATLLVMQSIVLALGAVPAYCLGRRVWAPPSAGPVPRGVCPLYPPPHVSKPFHFHADTFSPPILLAAFASLFSVRS